jgi:hypothetical protein
MVSLLCLGQPDSQIAEKTGMHHHAQLYWLRHELFAQAGIKLQFSQRRNNFKWLMNYVYTHAFLSTGKPSEKCVIRWFHPRMNILEYVYINLNGISYYTPKLHDIAYCS